MLRENAQHEELRNPWPSWSNASINIDCACKHACPAILKTTKCMYGMTTVHGNYKATSFENLQVEYKSLYSLYTMHNSLYTGLTLQLNFDALSTTL